MELPTRACAAVALGLWIAGSGCAHVPKTTLAPGREPLAPEECRRIALRAGELYDQQPRRMPIVQESFALYWKATEGGGRDFEVLWRAARAGCWVAQRTAEDEPKVAVAKRALALANSAVEVGPDRPEGYYYRALASGHLASADHDYGLDAMKEMIADGERVLAIDEKWNGAAGHRLLGNVYHKSPGPPIGKGSDRKAREHLTRATALAPDYPGNWIHLLELDVDEEELELGRNHLQKFYETLQRPELAAEQEEWRAQAKHFADALNEIEKD